MSSRIKTDDEVIVVVCERRRFRTQLAHGAGEEDQPAIAAQRAGRRDGRAEALRIGVVAVVQDRETALLEQIAPARREGELFQRGACGITR